MAHARRLILGEDRAGSKAETSQPEGARNLQDVIIPGRHVIFSGVIYQEIANLMCLCLYNTCCFREVEVCGFGEKVLPFVWWGPPRKMHCFRTKLLSTLLAVGLMGGE